MVSSSQEKPTLVEALPPSGLDIGVVSGFPDLADCVWREKLLETCLASGCNTDVVLWWLVLCTVWIDLSLV